MTGSKMVGFDLGLEPRMHAIYPELLSGQHQTPFVILKLSLSTLLVRAAGRKKGG
jgi:hypothetical protein